MKKFFGALAVIATLLTCFPFVGMSAGAASSDVPITPNVFPDEQFRYYVQGVLDKNGDMMLNSDEISNVSMDLRGLNGISTLEGIQHIRGLVSLKVYNGQFSKLNINDNTQLKELIVEDCRGLSFMPVSANTALETLSIKNSQITELDLDSNMNLKTLNVSGSAINVIDINENKTMQSIDASNCKQLQKVELFDSPAISTLNLSGASAITSIRMYNADGITSLDTSGMPNLTELSLSNSKIKILDVTKNTLLEDLDISGLGTETIDLSKCTKLKYLEVSWSDYLTTLDVSACNALETISLDDLPLTSLKMGSKPNLTVLSITCTDITSVDISGCTALEHVNFYGSDFTTLDLSPLTKLKTLRIDWNQSLTSLNLKKCALLEELDCSVDDLLSLDLSGNPKLRILDCSSNRKLTSLNLSHTPLLEELDIDLCDKLPYPDLTKVPKLKTLDMDGQEYSYANLEMLPNLTTFKPPRPSYPDIVGQYIDLSKISGDGFDPSRVSNVQNGTLVGTSIKVKNHFVNEISYDYDTGNSNIGKILIRFSPGGLYITEEDNVVPIAPQRYTGKEIKPTIQMKCGDEKIPNYYFDIAYSNNIEVGTASVNIKRGGMEGLANMYHGDITVNFEILKGIPTYTVPTGLQGMQGMRLSSVALPKGFTWTNPSMVLSKAGDITATATYTPEDTAHYESIPNITLTISVAEQAGILGDVSMDGLVNVTDATLALTYFAQSAADMNPTFSEDASIHAQMLVQADMNGDGTVNTSDASMILQQFANAAAGVS